MEKHALRSHYVVTGSSTGWKRSLPLLSLLWIQKRSHLQHYLAWIRPPLTCSLDPPIFLKSSALEQFKSAVTLSVCLVCQRTPDRTCFPVTTACVQAPGSPTEVKRLCLMTGLTMVTPALPTETVYKFHNKEQGQISFCFLPQISYSMKVKCPHEGSRPGLVFCC